MDRFKKLMLNPKEQTQYLFMLFLCFGIFNGAIDLEYLYIHYFDKIFLIFLAINLLYLFINRKKLPGDLIKRNALYSIKYSLGLIVMMKIISYLIKIVVDPFLVYFFVK